MGLVIEFGVPMVRARRRNMGGFCEVTIFPGAQVSRREEESDDKTDPDDSRSSDMKTPPPRKRTSK